MPEDKSNLLTTGQAAKLCSVTPDTILKWLKRGRLNGVRTAGGHYRIERRASAGPDLAEVRVTVRPLGRPAGSGETAEPPSPDPSP